MHAYVSQYLVSYRQEMKPNRDSLRYLLDIAYKSMSTTPTIELQGLATDAIDDAQQLNYFISKFRTVRENVLVAAYTLRMVNMTDGLFNLKEDVFQSYLNELSGTRRIMVNNNQLPSLFVSKQADLTNCFKESQHLSNNLTSFADQLTYVINNLTLLHSDMNGDAVNATRKLIPEWNLALKFRVPIIKSHSAAVMSCADEYEEFLMRIQDEQCTFSTNSVLDQLDPAALHHRLEEQVVALESLYKGYASFQITKHQLSYMIDATIKDDIEDILTEIEKKSSGRLVSPTLSLLASLEEPLTDCYVNALTDVIALQKYFSQTKSIFEERGKNASVWRKPYPDIESKKLLKFSLSEQAGRSSVPDNMENFLAISARTDIRHIISSYLTKLKDTVSAIETNIISRNKRQIMESLTNLITNLLTFATRITPGSVFVK
jgi:hypothetical protein